MSKKIKVTNKINNDKVDGGGVFRYKLLSDFFADKEPLIRSIQYIKDLNKYSKKKINTSVILNSSENMTILQYIAKYRHKIEYWRELFMYLVDNGIDINGVSGTWNKLTVLEYVCDDADMCHYVLTHKSFNPDPTVLTKVMKQFKFDNTSHLELYKLMHDKGGIPNYDILINTSNGLQEDLLRIRLITDYLGKDIHSFDPPIILRYSSKYFKDQNFDAYYEFIGTLLKRYPNINMNKTDKHGANLMFYVKLKSIKSPSKSDVNSSYNKKDRLEICDKLIRFLIEKGVDANLVDNNGNTLLDYYLLAKMVKYNYDEDLTSSLISRSKRAFLL